MPPELVDSSDIPPVAAQDIYRDFGNGSRAVHALQGFSLTVRRGEIVAFMSLATMLIGTSREDDVITMLLGMPRQHIGIEQFHCKTDVWITVDIGNRGRDVILTHYL